MSRPRAFDPDTEILICDAYDSGLSAEALASLYGVHKVTVLTTLRRNGIEPRAVGRPRTGQKGTNTDG